MDIEALRVGTVFLYYGPRRWPLGRRGLCVGRIIALDTAEGIAHVCTYRAVRDGARDGTTDTQVGHIPILCSWLARSLHSIREVEPFDPSPLAQVQHWRDRHQQREVGAFDRPLWKAEQLAWQSTPRQSPKYVRIEYAYPKADANGRLTIVEVVCARRSAQDF